MHYAHHKPAFSWLLVPGLMPALWGCTKLVQSQTSIWHPFSFLKSSSWFPTGFSSPISTPLVPSLCLISRKSCFSWFCDSRSFHPKVHLWALGLILTLKMPDLHVTTSSRFSRDFECEIKFLNVAMNSQNMVAAWGCWSSPSHSLKANSLWMARLFPGWRESRAFPLPPKILPSHRTLEGLWPWVYFG